MRSRKLNILIMGSLDNDKNRLLILLQNEGYTVSHSASVQCDLKYIKKFDLIVVDCRQGFELLKSIMKNNTQNKNHLISLENNTHGHELEVYGVEKTRNGEVELVQKACQYLLSDLSLKLSHKELAYKMATNHNKLAQASKNVLGMGVFHWLAGERMKEAKRLCITTDLSIQEI
ncbi:MAG: hypothetical protein V3T17_09240, partial [Pseudomonadales bacterium]